MNSKRALHNLITVVVGKKLENSESCMKGRPPIAKVLGYSENWFRPGVIDDLLLEQQRIEWETGLDTNPEHYRYSSFRRFLAGGRPLTADLAAALFSLGLKDHDLSMGGAIMADIVRLPECPQSVLDAAIGTGRKHLEKIVARRSETSD